MASAAVAHARAGLSSPLARAAAAWEAEYAAGRYCGDPPTPFVSDVVAAARAAGVGDELGLYIGCGNGRNYVPLVESGLDLVGLDLSATALAQLAKRPPVQPLRLVCGDLGALPAGVRYALVVGIQVFQHGDRVAAHGHVRAAQRRLARGGIFCVRVNAVGTDVALAHDLVEGGPRDGFTVRYLEGPKRGLDIHFFAEAELDALFHGYRRLLPPRLAVTARESPQRGRWCQWEAIWQKPYSPDREGAERSSRKSSAFR
jgi:SAM-dependent methyltransferase